MSTNVSVVTTDDILRDNPALMVPVKLNDVYYQALLDTGADISCIHTTVARELALELQVFEGNVTFAGRAATDIKHAMVIVSCGNHSFPAQVLVFDLTNNKKMLLGRDLMAVFGSVSGIPLSTNLPDIEDVGVKVPYAPDTVENECLAKLLNAIQNALVVNEGIDRADLCTLPYAVVNLETGEAAPVNRRQYVIPNNGNIVDSNLVTEAAPGSSKTDGSRRSSRKRKHKEVLDL